MGKNKTNKPKTKRYFRKEIDSVFSAGTEMMKGLAKSEILQEYLFDLSTSLVYGNVIANFFNNLTPQNIKEINASVKEVKELKNSFRDIRNEVSRIIKSSSIKHKIDEKYYTHFKSELKSQYPNFMKIMDKIENTIDLTHTKKYLDEKRIELNKIGRSRDDIDALFSTIPIEMYIQKKSKLPNVTDLKKLFKTEVATKVIEKFSQRVVEALKLDTQRMLEEEQVFREGFEQRLYQRWKEPIDLLQALIRISLETSGDKRKKLVKNTNKKFKFEALFQIHARSNQIANEILNLVRGGYADAALARWRTLHELAVISFFLNQSNDDMSQRYLEHEVMRIYKESRDYKKYRKKLGYEPISRKIQSSIKRAHDKLIQKYGAEFEYRNGWEWLPITQFPRRSFAILENHVNIDRLHPFYNSSSNAIHGGSRGFYRWGLTNNAQKKILLVGASNYGLADPIQNTAISLSQVSASMLTIDSDFESLVHVKIIADYVDKIKSLAVIVQKKLEKETRSSQKNNPYGGFYIP